MRSIQVLTTKSRMTILTTATTTTSAIAFSQLELLHQWPWRSFSHPHRNCSFSSSPNKKSTWTFTKKTRNFTSLAAMPFDLSPPPIDHDLLVSYLTLFSTWVMFISRENPRKLKNFVLWMN